MALGDGAGVEACCACADAVRKALSSNAKNEADGGD